MTQNKQKDGGMAHLKNLSFGKARIVNCQFADNAVIVIYVN